MGYISRFLLLLYAFAVMILSVALAAACLNIVPVGMLIAEAGRFASRQEVLAGAGIAFLLSVYFVWCSLCSKGNSTKSEKEVILLKGTTGEVRLSVEAVRNMVERAAISVSGVREIKANISAHSKAGTPNVGVDIQTVLSREKNVTVVSDEIRAVVSHDLERIAGIGDYSVTISVKDISNSVTAKKQRVV